MAKRILHPRKLLVASTGVMTISYLMTGCDSPPSEGSTVANLMAAPSPTPNETSPTSVIANLPAPPILTSCVANLPAPPAPQPTPTAPTVSPMPDTTAPPLLDAGERKDAAADAIVDAATDAAVNPEDASSRTDTGHDGVEP